jgi:aldehyde dehydrogenase (NAD+)
MIAAPSAVPEGSMNGVFQRLGLSPVCDGVHIGSRSWGAAGMAVRSPIDGRHLATVRTGGAADVDAACAAASAAFARWRCVPAPRRGELVRRIGETVRARKDDLAALISLEVGKITQEALGEVQEWIDICEFAVGLSRQLHGLTIASERPDHRMMEQWHPLGPVGVITAFNFPIAVWAWNAMLGLVCGDPLVWKPSEKTPLCAVATHRLCQEVIAAFADAPAGLISLVVGDRAAGEALCADGRVPLISATGSVPMGRAVARQVAGRLGRSLLELGGNNALIVASSADLEMAVRAITFAAVGTCGQRCTTLRRLIVHRSMRDRLMPRLLAIYGRLPIGDPSRPGTLVGPLIDGAAFTAMERALAAAQAAGGIVHGGGRVTTGVPAQGFYVRPALVELDLRSPIVQEETFAPILYVGTYDDFSEAVALNNGVPQGLSSAVFTGDVRESERFMAPDGSDCGIVNINIGTSGAEIGGAFGGEKWTGGGRESGSDAWKAYMRRVTNTVNYGSALPLAQGVDFDV